MLIVNDNEGSLGWLYNEGQSTKFQDGYINCDYDLFEWFVLASFNV
jgi:hypothetical protein